MTKLTPTHLLEPLFAMALLAGAFFLMWMAPESAAAVAPTSLLTGALLRAMLPVNEGAFQKSQQKRWQSLPGVKLSSKAEAVCIGLALAGTGLALAGHDTDLRFCGLWLGGTALAIRFASALPVWRRK